MGSDWLSRWLLERAQAKARRRRNATMRRLHEARERMLTKCDHPDRIVCATCLREYESWVLPCFTDGRCGLCNLMQAYIDEGAEIARLRDALEWYERITRSAANVDGDEAWKDHGTLLLDAGARARAAQEAPDV